MECEEFVAVMALMNRNAGVDPQLIYGSGLPGF